MSLIDNLLDYAVLACMQQLDTRWELLPFWWLDSFGGVCGFRIAGT
jgi:hypothetical protein